MRAASGGPAAAGEEEPLDARLGDVVTLEGHHPWTPPDSLEAWLARRDDVRRRVLVAAGLWPSPERGPVAHVTGRRVERDGYTVEGLRFETLPGFWVCGNLYRPTSAGPHPGVLSPHGHWTSGRFQELPVEEARGKVVAGEERELEAARYFLQARCAHLARMGCVVLHWDMVGYGETQEIPHGAGFADPEAIQWQQSAFGLQTWNSLRALDLLAALEDVDPERIGVTGASGGGTQTFVLCAVDERPRVAFPAVMVSADMQGGCACENAPHLRVGTTNVEITACAAPRPLFLTGANDWTRGIEETGLPELRQVYGLFDAEERVGGQVFAELDHNFGVASRELLYAWFAEHLELDVPAELLVEARLVPVPPAGLAVLDQHPLPKDAVDARGVRAWWMAEALRARAELAPVDADSLARYREVVGGALAVLCATELPAAADLAVEVVAERALDADAAPSEGGTSAADAVPSGGGTSDADAARSGGGTSAANGSDAGHTVLDAFVSRRGAGERVPVRLVTPAQWSGTVLVLVSERGRAGLDSGGLVDVERALARGVAVLALDPLLVGAADGARLGVDEGWHDQYAGFTWGYNRTLLAERVHDVLTAIAFARSREGVTAVHLVGGDAGSADDERAGSPAAAWALLAAALAGDAVERTAVLHGWDFDAVIDLDDPDLLPGALRYGGVAGFAALLAPRPLALAGTPAVPTDLAHAWAAAHADAALVALDSAEILAWLLRAE